MILELFEALRAYLYKGRSRIAPDRLESLSRGAAESVLFGGVWSILCLLGFRTFTNLM